jgi:hypothetical protein
MHFNNLIVVQSVFIGVYKSHLWQSAIVRYLYWSKDSQRNIVVFYPIKQAGAKFLTLHNFATAVKCAHTDFTLIAALTISAEPHYEAGLTRA